LYSSPDIKPPSVQGGSLADLYTQPRQPEFLLGSMYLVTWWQCHTKCK